MFSVIVFLICLIPVGQICALIYILGGFQNYNLMSFEKIILGWKIQIESIKGKEFKLAILKDKKNG